VAGARRTRARARGATLLPWDGGRDAPRRARGDVEGPGPGQGGALGGVEVLLDGEPVATSADDGMCVVALESEPEALTYRLPDWRVLREGATRRSPLQIVEMMRAP
jgi:hypothetical protein